VTPFVSGAACSFLIVVSFCVFWPPNALRVSRAQGMLTNRDDDHAQNLSQKARVGVGWMRRLNARCRI
jgi:type II secretory pathway component PulM